MENGYIPQWADKVTLKNGQYEVEINGEIRYYSAEDISNLSGPDSWCFENSDGKQVWFRKGDTILR